MRRLQKGLAPAAIVSAPSHSPFTIDDTRKTIHYCQQLLSLSRTEYRLLQILIAAPGRVFSRETLMKNAWEHPDVSLDRTVDTHIKLLRQQLRSINPDVEAIITHRGVGYALKDDG